MSRNIEREFQSAMNGLAFSSYDRKRLLEKVMQAGATHSKRLTIKSQVQNEEKMMKSRQRVFHKTEP